MQNIFQRKAGHMGLSGTQEEQKTLGISEYSCLLSLPKESINYCRTAPYTTMHLIAIRVISELLKLWRGEYYFDQPDEDDKDWEPAPYNVREHWDTMGDELESSRSYLPTGLGPTPFNIAKSYPTFKRRVYSICIVLFLTTS